MDTDSAESVPFPIKANNRYFNSKPSSSLIKINYPKDEKGMNKIIEKIISKTPQSDQGVNDKHPFEKGSRLARALDSQWTDRSFDEYLDLLGITAGNLGGLVMDIGTGKSELFAREAQKKGIDVVSVSPMLSEEQARRSSSQAMKEDVSYKRKAVAALAQVLPFKDNCFDSIVSVFSIPHYLDPDDLSIVFKEILRVLKPGGKAFLSPIFNITQIRYEQALKDLPCAFNFSDIVGQSKRLFIEKQQAPTLIAK